MTRMFGVSGAAAGPVALSARASRLRMQSSEKSAGCYTSMKWKLRRKVATMPEER